MVRLFLIVVLGLGAWTATAQEVTVQAPGLLLTDIPFEVTVRGGAGVLTDSTSDGYLLRLGETTVPLVYDADTGTLVAAEVVALRAGGVDLEVVRDGVVLAQQPVRTLPGWVSIVPPILAILIALLFKRVIPALFLGIWVGAWLALELTLPGLWGGLLQTVEIYVLTALTNEGHASIILFSLLIGGMVGIISRNGGMQGVVNGIVGWASTARKGQLATAILGIAIFFDDYANTLVVGNTMRPVTDRLRISREKLAYLVDSTAAPVACLAFVTTWIGYEVGLIGAAVEKIPGFNESAYSVFLNSILYSFYPILALFFVFGVANSRRDFGPMYDAEYRARTTGQVLAPDARVDEAAAEGAEVRPKEDKPHRALNAVVPIVVLVVSVLGGLYITGLDAAGDGAGLRDIIGSADSYKALLWGSLLGVLAAIGLSVGQRILTLEESVEAWYGGLKSMLFAMIILILAWSLSNITEVLHTGEYLKSVLGETLPPGIVPAIVFVLAAATAFATGSSWGTMGILMPLVIPTVWAVMQANGVADPSHYYLIYSSASCVLAGAVWGDHCSPISDTTILSSMASGCDHIDHVRTQLPYAVSVGIVAICIGTIPTGFGFPWWLSILIGAALLSGAIRLFGKRIGDEVGTAVPDEQAA